MKIKGEYAKRNIAGETVIVPISGTVKKSNIIVVLNDMGNVFWNYLYEGNSEDEIINAICNEYDTDKKSVKNDLDKFVEYIIENGIELED